MNIWDIVHEAVAYVVEAINSAEVKYEKKPGAAPEMTVRIGERRIIEAGARPRARLVESGEE